MVLVTGASGLVGLHLIKQLSIEGYSVRALYHSNLTKTLPETVDNQIEWVNCDILNVNQLDEAFKGIRTVYHCAAIVSYDPRYAERMMEINVEGTANVINIALEHQVDKLVYMSSIASLGNETYPTLVAEKSEWDTNEPHSQYAISKQKAEMEVWRGIAEGLNAVIVNPAIILGEGDWEKSSTNLFQLVYNEFPYYTSGETAWVDVKDVVNIMMILMNSTISGEQFILSTGNYSYQYIFTQMALAMNKKPPYKKASKWMTELVWRFSYLKSLITNKQATISKETARASQEIKHYSNKHVLSKIDNFAFANIEETVKRVCIYFLKAEVN
jgi:nucleoside-diphosphate-sugar epimerase